MDNVPVTSISILSEISKDADSARWAEFVKTYDGTMRGFLFAKFPSLEADDVIQETLAALVKALPAYRYTPDEKGHFRNYLIGILRHKASDILRRRVREQEKRQEYGTEIRLRTTETSDDEEEREFRESLLNAAVDQLLADESVNPTHREIFRHVVLMREAPNEVAGLFGVTRNNVDQIKNRLRARLATIVTAMESSARPAT